MTLGNFSDKRIVVSNAVRNLYPDARELVLRAKCVSGILKSIKRDQGARDRWLGTSTAVMLSHINAMLSTADHRVSVRCQGIVLNGYGLVFDQAGEWLMCCLDLRARIVRKRVPLRLLLEVLVKLCVVENDTQFTDILSAVEAWLVRDTCDSCLKKILRDFDSDGRVVSPFPFPFWEHRDNDRMVSVNDALIQWVCEPHDTTFTFGKVIKILGRHDFMVLSSTKAYITLQIRQDNIMQRISVSSVYFSSFHTILDGYFHHLRSIVLENSNKGLVHWKEAFASRILDADVALRRHFRDLMSLRGLSPELDRLVSRLIIWMMTSLMDDVLVKCVSDRFYQGADMFQEMLIFALTTNLPATLFKEYVRVVQCHYSSYQLHGVTLLS